MAQIVTITNPLTGQPVQVDQLEHTAQQIDDAIARALPGGAIDTLLSNKADASSVYTKTESDTLLANKTNASAPALYDVPLASGYNVPWGGFRYGKDQFGVVHLYGIFATTSGMVKGNNTIGTLPEGFRPTMQVHAAAVLTLNDVIDSVAQFHVSPNGTLTCSLGKNITSGNVVDVGVDISFVSTV